MAIIARDSQKEYAAAPEGLHQAVCVDVVDQGLVETPYGKKHKIQIRWQTEDTYKDKDKLGNEYDRPYMVLGSYTLSLSNKATLRRHLEAWRGRKFTAEELNGFDVEQLVGVNCQLQLVHSLSTNGRTFANVQAIVPLGKTMVKIQPDDYTRVKDRVDDQSDSTATPEPEDSDLPF